MNELSLKGQHLARGLCTYTDDEGGLCLKTATDGERCSGHAIPSVATPYRDSIGAVIVAVENATNHRLSTGETLRERIAQDPEYARGSVSANWLLLLDHLRVCESALREVAPHIVVHRGSRNAWTIGGPAFNAVATEATARLIDAIKEST